MLVDHGVDRIAVLGFSSDRRSVWLSNRRIKSVSWLVVPVSTDSSVEFMGIPALIAAIVSGAVAIGTTVAGAVAKKKQQKREKAMLEKQQEHERIMAEKAALPASSSGGIAAGSGMLLPIAALGVGALLLKKFIL